MLYASRSRHGIWRYRRALPEALRSFAGRREYLASLGTRDDAQAAQRHARVHLEAEQQFQRWRAEAAGASVPNNDEWAEGLRFLRRNGLEYISLDQLRAEHQ